MSSNVRKRKVIDDKLIEKYLEEALDSDAEFDLDEPILASNVDIERWEDEEDDEINPYEDDVSPPSIPKIASTHTQHVKQTVSNSTSGLPVDSTELSVATAVDPINSTDVKIRAPISTRTAAPNLIQPSSSVSSGSPAALTEPSVANALDPINSTDINISAPISTGVAAPSLLQPSSSTSGALAASTNTNVANAVDSTNSTDVTVRAPIPTRVAAQSVPRPRLRAGRPNILPAWTTQEYTPDFHHFDESNSGLKTDLTFRSIPGEVFEHFLDNEIIEKLCLYTNQYAEKTNYSEAQPSSDHRRKWQEVTPPEMYTFIALTMLMTRKKALELHEYWATHNLLYQPIYSQTMSRDRYRSILTNIHYNDPNNENRLDKLTKLRPLLDDVTSKFKNSFVPYQKLVIDESLVLFKGRLQFKQYIPSKRSRFGVKFFVLCDTETDYILQFIIYVGLTTDIEDEYNLGQSGAVVTTLLKDYFNNGHTLYVDNWYSSPALFRLLLAKNTNACGTVRKNRIGLPTFPKLSTGQLQAKYTTDMMAFKWVDRRDVHFLSTFHSNVLKNTGKVHYATNVPIQKPEAIIDYNLNMGSIDKTDMLLSSLGCIRKTKKWYKKVGLHMIDLILLNAHSSFKMLTARESYPLADFQFTLIEQLILKHKGEITVARHVTSHTESLIRLIQRHFPSPVPATQSRYSYRRCHVCATTVKPNERKRTMTRFMCVECNISLCIHPCFQNYHTMLHY